jgi:hypothetical protein
MPRSHLAVRHLHEALSPWQESCLRAQWQDDEVLESRASLGRMASPSSDGSRDGDFIVAAEDIAVTPGLTCVNFLARLVIVGLFG